MHTFHFRMCYDNHPFYVDWGMFLDMVKYFFTSSLWYFVGVENFQGLTQPNCMDDILEVPVEFYDHPVGGMGGMNTVHFGVHFQLFNQSLHLCPL